MPRKPSVLFVNQHYWPDFAATGQYLADLAEYLVEDGFEVSVLCAQGGYRDDLQTPAQEVRNGVSIRRVRTPSFGRGRHIGRIADYGAYYTQVLTQLLTGPRYDLVIVLTTPPLLPTAAALARRMRGQRYAIWSMDLHPDAEVALGMLTERSALARSLHRTNDIGYRSADLVVDLGFRMKERIVEKGVDRNRLRTIGMWSDGDEVHPVPPSENAVRRDLGLRDDQTVVMYSGNAGLAHRFDETLEVMRRLKDDDRLFFLFVGSGPRRAEIESTIEAHGLTNARYVDYFPREQLAESLSAGDVHLLTLRQEMAGVAVPSKLYGILAAGRPVVMVGPTRSEPAQTILTAEVGAVIDPANGQGADQLEAALLSFVDAPDARRAVGARSRAYFEATHTRQVSCAAWATTLRSYLEENATVPPSASR